MTGPSARIWAGLLTGLLAGLLVLSGTGVAAAERAASDATITYAEPSRDGGPVSLLVSVPAGADVDPSSVEVRIGGQTVAATAASAGSEGTVRRAAVLAIDTSNSMAGPRFAAAQQAARDFLDLVPDDVLVGVVTFAGKVATPLVLTDDRDAARAVVDTLSLSRGTALHDAIRAAVDLAGSEGQRTVLVLSDGADTTDTSLADAAAAVRAAEVGLDVISLQGASPPLRKLAQAGDGRVVPAGTDALAAAFAAEAEALERQLLVTAELPDALTATEQTVTITLASASGPLVAEAFVPVAESVAGGTGIDAQLPSDNGWSAPRWTMWIGVLALGIGLVALAVLLVPRPRAAATPAERVDAYAAATARPGSAASATQPKMDREQALSQAKDAAGQVLSRSRGLEQRIGARLEAAGSQLKPPEWLLVHVGILVGACLLGLLLGGGSLGVALLFLVLGGLGPWLYLGMRRSRRRKKFDDLLPETLGLISGSLSAGLSLTQSVDTVVREGQEPIAGEFRRVLAETRLGVSLEEALEGVAVRFDSKDFEWVVMAIGIQRQVGGNLGELLNTVADTMRERAYVRRQVAALAAEGKLSAYVLGGLPPIFLLYLFFAQRDYVMVLFTDPRGLIMLVGAGLWLAIGAFWMSKLIKVEV
ncbi:Bacterial type II secretion system protein F domain protein [Nocardioides dokdonensis FR1436]|uniref:Bacterial type II secretion system protein F domain protein n=1 Tax=Nocardioides dokdonensis FR1436 TaxID=1300347 RepID=A0A1A9GLB7_9ACTN|nr:type II secretion system F family protein [Nocardioides dokdonensis]ANH39089.1 Bacterial type II secretion system protein F domain protein [Nocardioides dokdonensis FR1436]